MTKLKRGSSIILYLMMLLTLIIPVMLATDTYNCSPSTPAVISDQSGEASHQKYTILRPTPNETSDWMEMFRAAPGAYLSPHVKNHLDSAGGAHVTLLGHMNDTPSERDQGTCGNCWVWAGTGILEIALDSQLGIKDRLSTQYVNSNYNGCKGSGGSCCGGMVGGSCQIL